MQQEQPLKTGIGRPQHNRIAFEAHHCAGTLILGFQRGSTGYDWIRVVELLAGLAALFFLSRNARVDRWLTSVIRRLLRRYTDLPARDLDGLLDLSGDYSVIELSVMAGDWVAGRRLADLSLRDEGLVVLGISRSDGRYRGAPVGQTMLHVGDVLVLYGKADALTEIDHRGVGPDGDRRHELAVERQRVLVDREELDDRASARQGDASARPA